jgi:hypothetical protein
MDVEIMGFEGTVPVPITYLRPGMVLLYSIGCDGTMYTLLALFAA